MDSPPPPFRASSLDCEHDALPAVFDDIPDGPLSDIMGFLPASSLAAMACTSTRLRHVADDPRLWNRLGRERWPLTWNEIVETAAVAAAAAASPPVLPSSSSAASSGSAAAASSSSSSAPPPSAASASRRAFADAASARGLSDGAEKVAEITLRARRRRREEGGEGGASDDDGENDDDGEERADDDEGEDRSEETSAFSAAPEPESTNNNNNVPLFSSAPISASSAEASNAALDAAAFEQIADLLFKHFLPTSADPRLRRSGAYRSLRSQLHWWMLRRPNAVVAFARRASEALTAFGGAAAMRPEIGWPEVPRRASALRVVREAASGLDARRAASVASVVERLGRESDGLAALLAGVSIEDAEVEEEEEEGEEAVAEEEEEEAEEESSASRASQAPSSQSSSSSSCSLPPARPCACVPPGVPAAHWWFWGRTPAEATAARRAEAEAAASRLLAGEEEEAVAAAAAAAAAAVEESLVSPRQAVRA